MKRIERISIKGFQNHFESQLTLSPYVNIFIGPSYAGKSAILRAIRWVYRNEPLGDSFINDTFAKDGKACEVSLTLSDGTTVIRTKGAGVNQYRAEREGKELAKADNFGTEVPREILQALEMVNLYTWDDLSLDLNFGGQFDPAFLLGSPARVPARVFGKLIGLDLVDKATKLTRDQKREYQDTHKRAEEELIWLAEKLKTFPDIVKADELLEEASEKHLTVYMPLLNRGKTLVGLYEGWKQAVPLISNLHSTINTLSERIDRLSVLADELIKLDERIQTLGLIQKTCARMQQSRSKLSAILTNNKLQALAHVPERIEILASMSIKIERLRNIGVAAEGARDEVEDTHKQFENRQSLLSLLKVELDQTLAGMECCPYSGGEFFDTCKDTLRQEA